MPVPVFEQPNPASNKTSAKKEFDKISGAAAFFAIIFILMLAITVEFALLDVNRIFNPQHADCHVKGNVIQRVFETSRDAGNCDVQRYESARLLLHADVIVPIALIGILVLVLLNMRKKSLIGRIFRVTIMIFSFWLVVRIIYEALAYTLKHHALLGKYFVLITALAAVATMIIWLQRTMNKPFEVPESKKPKEIEEK